MCAYPLRSTRALTNRSGGIASMPKIVIGVRVAPVASRAPGARTPRPKRRGRLVGGLGARASFSPALHQAAGGWHPAPSYSCPEGRRPFRESPQRHPDPCLPSQTSTMSPLDPSDISYPAQSGSPLYPLLSAAPDATTRGSGIRSCDTRTKVNLKRAVFRGPRWRRHQFSPRSLPVSL